MPRPRAKRPSHPKSDLHRPQQITPRRHHSAQSCSGERPSLRPLPEQPSLPCARG
jgi:hypothetical protein